MPKRKSEGIPQPFQIRWDTTRKQWAVRQGERWRFTNELCLQVSTLSVGEHLTGVGVVLALERGNVVITA